MATRERPGDVGAGGAAAGPASRFVTADVSLVDAREEISATEDLPSSDADTAVMRRKTGEVSAARPAPAPAPLGGARVLGALGLRAKFNAALVFAFAVGLGVAGWLSDRVLRDNARQEVVQEARIMMESALSARAYTAQHVKPLLEDQLSERFLPETVSAYAATKIFLLLRSEFPDYTYKEASLDPRNPSNRASDWEADLINEFRNHRDRREIVAVRSTPTGQMLHLARPLVVSDKGCLTCHSTAERAPKSMIDKYGATSAFGWQVDDVVAAQVVTVPMSVPLERARGAFITFMLLLAGVFLLVLGLLNVLLHFAVIKPVVRMAALATDVSMGKEGVADYVLHGNDEIASLSRSFHRMRVSLEKAMAMLDE